MWKTTRIVTEGITTAEQIISKLTEVEVKINQSITEAKAIRNIGVSDQTYYSWRKEYTLALLGYDLLSQG